MPSPPALLFTCEHGGNRIPPAWRGLFAGREAELASHAGYDAGALDLARELGREFEAPLICADVSRLLVDLNRSPGNRGLFSPLTRGLPMAERRRILEAHYLPHREAVARAVAVNGAAGLATLHIAVHSFTPVLRGVVRGAGVGLLYDPARGGERAFCILWQQALRALDPALSVRRNSPYRGASDGLSAWLRRRHPESAYLGLELEMNQKFLPDAAGWKRLCERVAGALRKTLAAHWA